MSFFYSHLHSSLPVSHSQWLKVQMQSQEDPGSCSGFAVYWCITLGKFFGFCETQFLTCRMKGEQWIVVSILECCRKHRMRIPVQQLAQSQTPSKLTLLFLSFLSSVSMLSCSVFQKCFRGRKSCKGLTCFLISLL